MKKKQVEKEHLPLLEILREYKVCPVCNLVTLKIISDATAIDTQDIDHWHDFKEKYMVFYLAPEPIYDSINISPFSSKITVFTSTPEKYCNKILHLPAKIECYQCGFRRVLQIVVDLTTKKILEASVNSEYIYYKKNILNYMIINNFINKTTHLSWYEAGAYKKDQGQIVVPVMPLNYNDIYSSIERIRRLYLFS